MATAGKPEKPPAAAKEPEKKPEPKPEPAEEKKPEPKPEEKPKPAEETHADQYNPEMDVRVQSLIGGGKAYMVGMDTRLQVMDMRPGGDYRLITGWKMDPSLRMLHVRDLFHSIIQDGPVLIPQHIFTQDLTLRNAIRALAMGKQAKYREGGPGGRDLLLMDYNHRAPKEVDTQHQDSPERKPDQIPDSKKPAWRRNGGKKILPKAPVDPATHKEFKPATTETEAISRLGNHADKINYEGLPLKNLNSLVKATEHVIGKFGFKVDYIGYEEKRGKTYGRAGVDWTGRSYVSVRKSFTQNPEKYRKQDLLGTAYRKEKEIRLCNNFIKHIKEHPENYHGDMDAEIKRQEANIARYENVKHWIVADGLEDPLYGVAVHESWHSVYFYHDLERVFAQEMERGEGWKHTLTEYARENKAEFFAELGAAVTCGYEVHPALKEIFMNTLKNVRSVE